MARPKKSDDDRYVKTSISFEPQQLEKLMHYCQVEERTMSWVIRKALDLWFKEQGIE